MKTPSQPRAIYYIVAIQIWEYFSFTACAPYSSFTLPTSLASTTATPSACSALTHLWFTLPLFSAAGLPTACSATRTAVIAGALLMTLGHVVLGVESTSAWSLYVALAIIICGYGLFKSNISCLLGELYAHDDPRRVGGFSLLLRRRQRRLDCRAHRLRTGGAVVRLAYRLRPCGDRYVYRPDDFLKRQPPLPAYPRRR